jgi:hypothetical protein
MAQEKFCVVYRGNIVHTDLLKWLLEAEGIAAMLEDEFVGMIAPYLSSPGGAQAVKVLVAQSDVDRARGIVEEFIKNHSDTT